LDVANPELVRRRGHEVTFDQGGGWPHARHADGRFRPLPRHRSGEPLYPHKPLDPLTADVDALLTKSGVDTAGAIGAAALAVDLRDPLNQPGISESTIGRRSPLPSVEARARNAEQPAHQRDRVVGLLRRDEPKQVHRVSLSFTKKAAAFFRISRSCSSSNTRRRSS